jgi:hypothetical protein
MRKNWATGWAEIGAQIALVFLERDGLPLRI